MEAEKQETSWGEIIRFVVISLIIVVAVRVFLAEPFVVSGSSMVPTFENGNYLIVDKVSYKLANPSRDDVIVFRYPNDPTKFFIKRIIGLPGETIEIMDDKVIVYNEENSGGITLDESYANILGSCPKVIKSQKTKLAADEYFVMGDNRECSSDSRFWGPLKRHFIAGRAFLRLWPVNKISLWPGYYSSK